MTRTSFDHRFGTEQGRLSDAVGQQPLDGQYLYVLGSDVAGRKADINAGDFGTVSQTGTFTGKVIRARGRLRGPLVPLEGDLKWIAQMRIDDVVVSERTITPQRSIEVNDLAWSISRSNGDVHTLGFRLMLRGTTTPSAEVELPAFYLDALVIDTAFTPRPQVINRAPEPDETRVPASSTIAFDIVDVGPTGVDTSVTQVFVNDVLAYSAGSFQSGFSGGTSAVTTPQADTVHFVIDPNVDFTSEEVVTVRVLTAITGNGAQERALYSFTVADIRSPRVESALSTSEKVVRVVFDEPMNLTLLPSPTSYVFTRNDGEIAVDIVTVGVAIVDDATVDLTLNQEITRGAAYTLTVNGPQDVSGNACVAPFNTAQLVGYTCPAPPGREWTLFDMLPSINREEDDGDLEKFIAVFQELGDVILCNVDRFADIIDPDLAPIEFVDAMLEDLGNPFDFALEEVDRRRLVQVLVPLYKQKGTGPGIIAAIRFFMAIEVTLDAIGLAPLGLGDWELGTTWILGSGELADLLTITINVPQSLTSDQRTQMLAIANYMRTEREHVRIVEPTAPPVTFDHLELGESELGVNWILHQEPSIGAPLQTITASGIASGAAVGTPTIAALLQTISPSGIASGAALGSLTVTHLPHLTSLNFTQADSAGGDAVTITGTDIGSATGCTVGGTTATITSNPNSTTLTFTMPAKAAGSYNVVVTTAAGTSNALSIEAWAPTDDASVTLLFDAKHTAYNASTGHWAPRYSVVGSADLVDGTGASGHCASDGSGGVQLDGNGAVEAGLIHTGRTFNDYVGSNVGGAHAGTACAVFSSQTTYSSSISTQNSTPYLAPAVIGNLTAPAGTMGLGCYVATDDSLHRLTAHQDDSGSASYRQIQVTMPTTGMHACLFRWGTSGAEDLSLDGALSGAGFATFSLTGGMDNTYTGNPMTVGTQYSASSAATQKFVGDIRVICMANAKVSDTFVTKFHKWAQCRHGAV